MSIALSEIPILEDCESAERGKTYQISSSDARRQLGELAMRARYSGNVFLVTRYGEVKSVIISPERYEKLLLHEQG